MSMDCKTNAPPRIVSANLDNWEKGPIFTCETCMYYINYRCRRHAPKGQEGWPAVFLVDWCGDHKIDKKTMQTW